MKRFLLCLILFGFLCGCSKDYVIQEENECSETVSQIESQNEAEEKIKAVWISCFELPNALKGEENFRSEIDKMMNNIKKAGCNTVIVHVRPFADSIYPSKIFPWSKYCCHGEDPHFDPLKIIISSAQKRDLSFHAWINPFRVSSSNDIESIGVGSPAKEMFQNKSGDVIALSNGIYFNPASPKVHSMIYSGVKEILENYDVDAIHIDDYFYPTTQEGIDKRQFAQYKKAGGEMTLFAWRKNSVTAFVAGLYQITKSYNKKLSISPSANLSYNEEKMYADIPLWMSEKGYVDIIIPQIYYGFKNQKHPFEKTADEWEKLKKNKDIRLVCGLANYKLEKEDENAGERGRREWIENKNIIEEQYKYICESKDFNGVAFFSYSYIF